MKRKREPLHSLGHRIGSLQSRGGNSFFFIFFFCWDGEKNHLSPAKPKLFFHSILPSFNTHPRQTGNYSQRQWRFFFWQQLLPLSHQKSFAAPFFISLGHRFYAEVFPVTIFQLQAMLIPGQKSLPWHVMPACTKYAYHLGKRQSWYGVMSRILLG